MIEQQYYTRERGGVFNQTDGYDTVAKSSQLKLDYIKKVLHPLCSYDIPSELQQVGEQNEAKYPPNMIIMPGESGELIVGQAVYKAQDFTGMRSTFFMHNLILSEYEKHRFMKEPEKLFGITGFQTGFNSGEGRELPTLAGVPYDGNNPYFIERERLFGKLGITNEVFCKLIYATLIAAISKKKIFIVLDVAIEELGEMAKALLYHLYTVLPWQVTEGLGICTYANKVEAKKGIQITFLDKNTLRYDTKTGKELIFDFVHKKYPEMEGNVEEEPYIKGAIYYSKNKMAWEKINHWIQTLSATLKDKSQRTIAFYNRVIVLFEMSMCLRAHKAYDLSNPKIRNGLMTQLLNDMQIQQIDEIRKELFEVMEYIISLLQEEIGRNQLIQQDELRALLQFKLNYCRNREQEEHCIQILLYLLTISSRNKEYAYIYKVLDEVHQYEQVYKSLFEAMYNNEELRKQVIYYLIQESFKDVQRLEELMEQMERFEEVGFILWKDQYYAQVVYEKFSSALRKVEDLNGFLQQLQSWGAGRQQNIYTNLVEQGEYYYLEHIQLSEIKSEAALCKLKFNRSYPLENYEVIQNYQKLKTDISCMSPNKIRVSNKVQELIKVFYKKSIRKSDFYMLVYAFLEMHPETNKPVLNMKRVLHYLRAIQMEVALEFIIWVKGQEIYVDKRRFDEQVINFFVSVKKKEGKINRDLIEAKLGGQAKTKALCNKILEALKPNFTKWVVAHGKLVTALALVGIVGVGGGMALYTNQKDKPTHIQETFKTHNVSVEASMEVIRKLMPSYIIFPEEVEQSLEKMEGVLEEHFEKKYILFREEKSQVLQGEENQSLTKNCFMEEQELVENIEKNNDDIKEED